MQSRRPNYCGPLCYWRKTKAVWRWESIESSKKTCTPAFPLCNRADFEKSMTGVAVHDVTKGPQGMRANGEIPAKPNCVFLEVWVTSTISRETVPVTSHTTFPVIVTPVWPGTSVPIGSIEMDWISIARAGLAVTASMPMPIADSMVLFMIRYSLVNTLKENALCA